MLAQARGAGTQILVAQALLEKDGNGQPIIPMIRKAVPTYQREHYDKVGVDYWLRLNQYMADELALTDSLPVQVKSSWCGVKSFRDQAPKLLRESLDKGYYDTRKVLVLNGQRPADTIRRDFVFAVVDFAGLPRNPNNRKVWELLDHGFHPELADEVLERMWWLNQTGCIYDSKSRNPTIQGTVVVLPTRRMTGRGF